MPSEIIRGTVTAPYWDWDGRKYVEISGRRIKVPFRYGRVMCHMTGLKTIQEFKKGDLIQAYVEKKFWDGDEFWVLISAGELDQSTHHTE